MEKLESKIHIKTAVKSDGVFFTILGFAATWREGEGDLKKTYNFED